MDHRMWRKRITNRTDMAARITHLTRGASPEVSPEALDKAAFDNLWKILMEKKLNGSGNSGYVIGNQRAVCFQEVPLSAIAENLLYEEELDDKIRYSWFGIRFNKSRLYENGARPVFYGNTEELKKLLTEDQYWRIVNMNLNPNNMIDWSHEREWRILGDLTFEYSDIEILVKDDFYYQKFVRKCIDEGKSELLLEIHGVIPLNTVIS